MTDEAQQQPTLPADLVAFLQEPNITRWCKQWAERNGNVHFPIIKQNGQWVWVNRATRRKLARGRKA